MRNGIRMRLDFKVSYSEIPVMRREGAIAVIVFLILVATSARAQNEYVRQREAMVRDQIERRGIRDPEVLKSMRKVARHQFVPEQYKGNAYQDGPLPIGHGQTISQPYVVAFMTEITGSHKDSRVLEIGTGSGYQAAVLAEIVKEVYTIEIISELGEKAEKRLRRLGYDNIKTRTGDGYYGWEEHAPFDAIVVTAASETIPPPLIRQLRDGGKMIIPVGSPFFTQYLILAEKKNGKITTKNVMPVRFVPFTRSDRNN